MQADEYYSKYLNMKQSRIQVNETDISIRNQANEIAEKIISELNPALAGQRDQIERIVEETSDEIIKLRVRRSRAISVLFLDSDKWESLVKQYKNNRDFLDDVELLKTEKLISITDDDLNSVILTDLGTKIAASLSEGNRLWGQKRKLNKTATNIS